MAAHDAPAWLVSRLPPRVRWGTIFRLALRMAVHDRQQTMAAIFGVTFAFVLVGQQVSAAGHYLFQASTYIDDSSADLWILPPAEKVFSAGSSLMSTSVLHQARVTPGVAWAEPVVRGNAWVRLPDGGARSVFLVGASGPPGHGGPRELIAGEATGLLKPNAIIMEDYDRDGLGGINLGSTIEVSGHRAHVEGFTWGKLTAFNTFAFAEYDFARSMLEIDSDRLSCVLLGVDDPTRLLRIQKELQAGLPEATVLTTAEYRSSSFRFVLFELGAGGIIVMGIVIGLVVGLGIVTLAMLSSVQQNIREFGTLKAIGATNADLRLLLTMQALGYSVVGGFLGAVGLCELAWSIRTPQLNLTIPPWLLVALAMFVTMISVFAALVVIRRVQRVEPASVFR